MRSPEITSRGVGITIMVLAAALYVGERNGYVDLEIHDETGNLRPTLVLNQPALDLEHQVKQRGSELAADVQNKYGIILPGLDSQPKAAPTPAVPNASAAAVSAAVAKLVAGPSPICPDKQPQFQYTLEKNMPASAICIDAGHAALDAQNHVVLPLAVHPDYPKNVTLVSTFNLPENKADCEGIVATMRAYGQYLLQQTGAVPKGQGAPSEIIADSTRPGASACDTIHPDQSTAKQKQPAN